MLHDIKNKRLLFSSCRLCFLRTLICLRRKCRHLYSLTNVYLPFCFLFNIYLVHIVYRFHNKRHNKPLVYIIYILFRIQLAGTWGPRKLIKASSKWTITTHNRNELTTYRELNKKAFKSIAKT